MGRITRKLRMTRVVVRGVAGAPEVGVAGAPEVGDAGAPEVIIGGRADTVAVEEPLEIRVAGQSLMTTMRTPGADVELVHGLLYSEGLIRAGADIAQVRYCGGTCGQNENTFNVVDVDLAPGLAPPDLSGRRLLTTTSACGICGTTSIEQVMARRAAALAGAGAMAGRDSLAGAGGEARDDGSESAGEARFDPQVLVRLPELLRERQTAFATTGGIHAAGIFTGGGHPVVIREDVGRHNAADKAIGALLMSGALPAVGAPGARGETDGTGARGGIAGPGGAGSDDRPAILALSGRASFELVQKAAMAGLGAVVAVSAASSLAIDLAADAGILLAGFTREGRMNVYTGRTR
ncbi:FdhD protein [Bowdeniella nasicola]|uniref:Sulfur carrier protein FdhD n=1 Tax=Bowdeniella nasicola TaxID=208480 RepID=A0A1H3ZRP1_9ACTO|nr:formate dehydrogenase accessory sulfurtransferase FdhD [Bowdeniella nasicola]SEA26369.1 FdhD protein [Bowdeniella nasicola]